MCRKKYVQGCCLAVFGLGVLVGYCLESWFLCICGGIALLLAGLCIMGKN